MVILLRANGACLPESAIIKGITIWDNQGEQNQAGRSSNGKFPPQPCSDTLSMCLLCALCRNTSKCMPMASKNTLELCRGVRTKERRVLLLEDLRDVKDQSRETKIEVMNRIGCKEQKPCTRGVEESYS